jgi:hypothetical protein
LKRSQRGFDVFSTKTLAPASPAPA